MTTPASDPGPPTSPGVTNPGNVGTEWSAHIGDRLEQIRSSGRWREYRDFDALGPAGVLTSTGRAVVSFASNDYLGLTAHPQVVAAAHAALDRWGAGTGGSRLITGSRPVHRELEQELADWKATERAVLFPTGFAANLGVLTTLGGPGVRIVSDSLNHASIIDGTRLARAEVAIAPHGDLAAMEELVATAPHRALVVTDTVFSMDGDVVDLAGVVAICRRHGALLVLDEAHAVLGPHPDADDLAGVEVVRVGTLSKTLGSLGGFAACSHAVADLLVNTARSSIFTTALSPADTAAALAALRVLRSPEGDALVARLRGLVDRLSPGHPSPIVAVVLGAEDRAVAAAAELLDAGLFVPAIRPPTVPAGTCRLRVTFSAAHTDEQVDDLIAALSALAGPTDTQSPDHLHDPNQIASSPRADSTIRTRGTGVTR